jgi:hypothetical protein
VARLDAARHPDSLHDVTKLRWAIVIGLVVGLPVGLVVAFGFIHKWGAEQWGPVAAWFTGAATLTAVAVALRQADTARRETKRLQLARLVDHEVSRRRECIEALGKLWGAITGMQTEFAAWTDNLKTLPLDSIPEEIQRFSWEWHNRIGSRPIEWCKSGFRFA